MLPLLNIIVSIFLNCVLIDATNEIKSNQLPLGKQKATLGPIKILHYEPTPEDFYHNFIWSSKPVLIRTKSPSWLESFASLNKTDALRKHYGETFGRAYKKTIWTKSWPLEIRLKFNEFLERKSENLYWDSQIPLNNNLLKQVPLPLCLQCPAYKNWISEGTVLYTNRNASSVFHQDGAENFFFQVSGQKTWLIAHPSFSHQAYANDYDTQPGLSPINPESVDLTRYPLVSEIDFYEITTKPGDMLYVPQHWWHQVRSHNPPIVSVNVWSEIFYSSQHDEKDVVQNSQTFAEARQSASPSITCHWQRATLYDALRNDHTYFFSPVSQDIEENFFLYFGSDEDAFYAVNSVNGQIIWKQTTPQDAGSTPVLSKNEKLIFFAGEDSTVYAYASESGELYWKTSISSGVAASLRLNIDESILLVAAIDGNVYGINTKTGKILWKLNSLKGEIWSSPLVYQNGMIVCFWFEDTLKEGDPVVLMIDTRNGKEIWRYSSNEPIFSSPEIDTSNGLLYVLDYSGRFHVLNAETGSLVQKFLTEGPCEASPVLSPNFEKAYFVTSLGITKRVDLKTRKLDWETEFNFDSENDALSSPLLSEKFNTLYVAVENTVRALNADTGATLWEFHANGTFISSPRIDKNRMLYIGCSDNMLYAIKATDGTLVWKLLTNGPVVSSVVMRDKLIEEGSAGGLIARKAR